MTILPKPLRKSLRSSEAAGTIKSWRADHPGERGHQTVAEPFQAGAKAVDPPVKPEITQGWILASIPIGMMHLACLGASGPG